MKTDIRGLFAHEIRAAVQKHAPRPYTADQVFRWLHAGGARNFDSMTNIPAALRANLAAEFRIPSPGFVSEQHSADGTVKFLLELDDGLRIETVLLTERRRKTQCVSTQVGCTLGCVFCATASLGFKRSLTAGEIIAQVEDVQQRQGRAGNLVFMGMGEPFLNYDNALRAIRILNDRKGLNIGARRMTVSTAGIPEGIRRFAGEDLQVRLALSLNATTDEQRSRLMPVNRRHGLAEVLEALDYYRRETGRRPTLEYVLVPGENDSDDDLGRLGEIARGLKANVNLIELNPGALDAAGAPTRRTARKWKGELVALGVEAAIRFRRGIDIHAGCGQLALRSAD
jgi:23S rRNA (adenine2503-C2)-methyltransferase